MNGMQNNVESQIPGTYDSLIHADSQYIVSNIGFPIQNHIENDKQQLLESYREENGNKDHTSDKILNEKEPRTILHPPQSSKMHLAGVDLLDGAVKLLNKVSKNDNVIVSYNNNYKKEKCNMQNLLKRGPLCTRILRVLSKMSSK